ncbi:MAG: pentapeptide repeat-containing protein [Pseudomonadota bacterium]
MRVPSLLPWRLAGLFHPEWPLRIGTRGVPARRESTAAGLVLQGQAIARLGPLEGDAGPIAELSRCDLTSGAVEGVRIVRAEGCRAPGSAWRDLQIAQLSLCDLTGARLERVGVELCVGAGLRGASITEGRLDELVMTDLFEARLERVRLGRACSADFSGATFVGCDLAGADLRGASLRRARFQGCDPGAAQVAGADFTGAVGLAPEVRRALLAAGARFQAAGWYLVLQRLLPSADPLRLDGAARWIQRGLLLAGLMVSAAGIWAVLMPRPIEPVPEPPPALAREATSWEIQKTRENLASLREALARAHAAMVSHGSSEATWPSMLDFQQNSFDLDGDGPEEARAELVPGGMPDNLLSDSVGSVLPYCNEQPTQETISGIDNDWHYCDQTGRLFACGGYTSLPTLEW